MTKPRIVYVAGVEHDLIAGKVTGTVIRRHPNGGLTRRRVAAPADPTCTHDEAERRLLHASRD
ncbi:hypothetical protein [Jannaschia sp. M317]|uniref:hypothetical protein n=1 Tax=Jannaschia sp. M317 TaxID=2867011 RepID=UPI0021A3DEE6|nr:hypothetical protein [Jannaschia sp. M317]UWQ17776.1 hypothetical protein K3551_00190 [Jannaschia sp. M317]